MRTPNSRPSPAESLGTISAVLLASFIIGMLFFAQDIIIPLALAALLTFLLAPLVTRLERWVGRVVAVILVVLLLFGLTFGIGWILTTQAIDLAKKLPSYKANLIEKVHFFDSPADPEFAEFSKAVEEIKEELPGGKEDEELESDPEPVARLNNELGSGKEAVQVEVVESEGDNTISRLQAVMAPLLGPLGTAALVLLLLVFMLLQREDLRNRLIRLVGNGRIGSTTRAMEDAGKRVTRYLLMQLVINVTYGIPLAIGLHFIGIPNAILWGGLAVVLRFIPWAGPWLAAIMPIALSLAVAPGWTMPLLTIGLFVVLELISNNVMEPWLYGSSTGVSPLALIVAAVFWTWMWGPVGLVLATPLTVCLVVLGRNVPRFAFLSILLSDEKALTAAEDCYHRLLSPGTEDEIELVEKYLTDHAAAELYDKVLVPALSMAETDALSGNLEKERLDIVHGSLREIVEDVAMRPLPGDELAVNTGGAPELGSEGNPVRTSVCIIPAKGDRDVLAANMLAHLLSLSGCEVKCLKSAAVSGELITEVGKDPPDVVCISVVSPSTPLQARYLCRRLSKHCPSVHIIVGLWGAENVQDAVDGLRNAGARVVTGSLPDAVSKIISLSPPPPQPTSESGESKSNPGATDDKPLDQRRVGSA